MAVAVVCIIPARGGSKGVHRKNLREVGGRTLIRRAVDAATSATMIDTVIVSTDDTEIAAEATEAGAEVLHRPPELAGDAATSESALLHALEHHPSGLEGCEVVVFVQCTSPYISPADLDSAIRMVISDGYDCVFAAVRSHAFLWRLDKDGNAVGVNHSSSVRLRRQDLQAEYRETGAFYVMRASGFRLACHRFFGRVGVYEVAMQSAIEIDSEDDLSLADRFSTSPPKALDALRLSNIDALVTDFDGVHTNDTVMTDEDGRESVVVSRSDGMGLALLQKCGLPVLILSKERNSVVSARAHKLGVECRQGVDDKVTVLRQWVDEKGLDMERIVYVGNDINDIDCLRSVGYPIVVADAHVSARNFEVHTTNASGGAGAIREIADRLLASNPKSPIA